MRWRVVVGHLATLVGTALILLFLSEFLFLNEGPVATVVTLLGDRAGWGLAAALGEFVLVYVVFAYALLGSLHWFSVRTITDLFLVGALVGWAIEGIVIPLVYEAVPVSIVWPSVAWHSLVDVLLGWYLLRRLMRSDRGWHALAAFTLVGIAWGAWATWLWTDPEVLAPLDPATFAAYATATSTLWIGGMALVDQVGTAALRVRRWEARVWFVVAGASALFMAASALPLSLAIIPFVWLTIRALRRPTDTTSDELVTHLTARPPWTRYLAATATPLSAIGMYTLMDAAQWRVPSEDIVVMLLLAATGAVGADPVTAGAGAQGLAVLLVALLIGSVLVSSIALISGSFGRDFIGIVFFSTLFMIPLAVPAFGVLFPGSPAAWIQALPTHGLVSVIVGVTTDGDGLRESVADLGLLLAWCVAAFAIGVQVLRRRVARL